MTLKKPFGPRNEKEARTFAEENFRIDVQMLIHELMEQKDINQKELAELLGVTEARVSQFFTDRFNMTVRKLAGVFHVLGERPVISVAPTTKALPAPEAVAVSVHVAPQGARALPAPQHEVLGMTFGHKFDDALWALGPTTVGIVVASDVNPTRGNVLPARETGKDFEGADSAEVSTNDPLLERAA